MRWLFLVPEITGSRRIADAAARVSHLYHRHPLTRWAVTRKNLYAWARLTTPFVHGGALNIMRHADVAHRLGADVALCTRSGRDTYGALGIVDLPYVAWRDRRADDVVLIPEIAAGLVSEHVGRSIVYLQTPNLDNEFDYRRADVALWTDSPFMLELCAPLFPGKPIPIVPNVVDPVLFPFRPQSEREEGLLLAFPRKNPEFITATRGEYERRGGRFWRFDLVDGLSIHALARRMQRPQAFLASAVVEGCALPPQESMACGIVVVGRSARGANFSMQHGETSMVAETPEEAAASLFELEDPALRDRLSRAAHTFIARYFPEAEPSAFWRDVLASYGDPAAAPKAR